MRILRQLFTPEDAELAVHLMSQPREPVEIAKHAGISVESAAVRLQEMEKKGMIMSMPVHRSRIVCKHLSDELYIP
jgi:hypothetical protein